MCCNKG